MISIIFTIILAVSETAKLEKRYINQFNARKAGGLFSTFGSIGLDSPAVPSGGYTNDALGIVVDAATPGTRTSGVDPTGLGGPRASYGSLDSKVGDAAFNVGGELKGAAGGIESIFGSGTSQGANIGLSGIGVAPGSSPGVSSAGGDETISITNPVVKADAIFGSGRGKANIRLPGIGVSPGFSSLDASGIKSTGAGVTNIGVTKTTYESVGIKGGNAALDVGNEAVQGSAFGIDQEANIGVSGIGVTPGSISLDAPDIKGTVADFTGLGVSKNAYESLDFKSTDSSLSIGNVANTGVGQAAEIGSRIKATGPKVTSFGGTKNTYELVEIKGGDAAVKEGATAFSSIFGSSIGQEPNIGLPDSTKIAGASSAGALGIKTTSATSAKVSSLDVAKTSHGSVNYNGEDETFSFGTEATNGGVIGVGSIFGSGIGQEANAGFSGTGTVKEASGLKTAGGSITSFGISQKPTHGLIDSKGEGVAFSLGTAALNGGTTSVGSISRSGTSQGLYAGIPDNDVVKSSSYLDRSDIKTGFEFAGLGVKKTSGISILDSDSEHAELGVGNEAVKGGSSGVSSIFGSKTSQVLSEISSSKSVNEYENDKIHAHNFASGVASVYGFGTSQKPNTGLPGIGITPGSSSLKAPGMNIAGSESAGFGVLKTAYESVDSKNVVTANGVINTGVKIGATGVGSTFGVGTEPSVGVVSGINSIGAVKGYENDENHAQKFANNAALSAKGSPSGTATIFGSSTGQKANTGLHNIGVVPGCSSSVATGEKTTGAEFTSHDVSKTTYGSIATKLSDPAIAIGDTGIKAGAGIFGSGIGQEANVGLPAIGAETGVSFSEAATLYEGDKINAQKFATEYGIKKSTQVLTSLEQNVKEPVAGHVDGGTYNVQEQNDKSDYSNSKGEINTKLSITSVDSTLKPNSVNQGIAAFMPESAAVEGSSENDQSLTSVEESFKNKLNSFGLNGQTKTQNKQELQHNVGKIGVTGIFQTASQESEFHKAQHLGTHTETHGESNVIIDHSSVSTSGSTSSDGTPNPVFQVTGSPNGNSAYSAAISTGSGIDNIFNTGNLNLVGQKPQGSKFASHLTSPSYSGYIDNSHKLTSQQGFKVLTNSFPLKEDTSENLQGIYFPTQNSLNLNSNTPPILTQSGQQDLTSTHYNGVTQAQMPHIPSPFPILSTNFGELSSNQGSFQSNHNQHSFAHMHNANTDQKSVVQGQSNKPKMFSDNPQFMSSFSSVSSEKLEPTQSSSLSYSGAFKSQSVQTTQSGVKPFGSSQTTVSQFGNTFGSQSSLTSQKEVGTISTVTSQVLPVSQYNEKPSASQFGQKSFQQSKFSLTSGSQFAKKQGTTGTVAPTSTDFNERPVATSQTGPGNQRNQFGFSSSSSNSGKLESTQSSSSSYTGASKGQSIQKSQLGVKPFGSFQGTGSTYSQSQSTLGAQSSLNSQTDVSHISTVTAQVKPISQYGKRPSGSQFGQTSFQQSQYSLTSGSQFGEKPETTGSIPQTSSDFSEKPVTASQTGSGNQGNQFGFSSSSLNGGKLESTQSSSSSYTGASKGQSIQKSQLGVKPFGSFQSTGSTFSQSQSTLEAQSSLNAQKDVGSISTVTAQVKPISQYGERPSGSHFGQTSFQQSQYSLTSGSQFGEKPETTGSIPQTSSDFSEKPVTASQTGSGNQGNQFGFSSSSLNGGKLESTQSSSSSYTGASKGQSIQKSQLGVKPFGSFQSTGSTFSQSQSTLGAQSSLNSQKDVGSISTRFQFGKKTDETGTISQISNNYDQKHTVASQAGPGNQRNQFGISMSSLNSGKLESTLSSSSSYTGASKGQSIQKSQLGVKPFGSFQGTGSTYSQSQSTLGAQSSLNSQTDVGHISTVTAQVKPISQYGKRPPGSQFGQTSFQQSQYSLTSGSQFGEKPETTGSIPQTSSDFSKKPVTASQTGSGNQGNQFGFSSSSLNGGKLESTQSSSSSYTGASKGQSIQKSQLGVKPFGSFQSTGSTFSQSQSTLGAQSSLNSQKDVGSISTRFQFGKKTDETGTISQISNNYDQKHTVASQAGPGNQRNQFGISSSSLNSFKLESTLSSSSSYTGASKGQSIQKSQLGVKPFGSFQGTGSTFSQSQSTLGAQSSLNSQTDVGHISTVTAQVKPISQYGRRPSGSQFGQTSFQQSQYSLTSGSQFGEKPETTGSIPQTSSDFSEKPVTASQTGSGNQGNQFGFSSSSLNGGKLESTQSSSSSYTGASKGQSIQKSQLGVKPFGSFQSTGSTFSQSQSTLGAQSSLNSQKDVGSISTRFQFGKKTDETGTISQISNNYDQKHTVASQAGPGNQRNQFGISSSSLNSGKLESTLSSSSSYTGASKGQSIQKSQLGVKPFGSFQGTGSTFSQSQSTLGAQSSLNSQTDVGSISTVTAQVKPISQYGKRPSGSQFGQTSFQQSQYSLTSGSQFGEKPETTGSIPQTSSDFSEKPVTASQTGSGNQGNQFGFSSSSLNGGKLESTQSSSSSYTGASKGQSIQKSQLGVKPFGSFQSTGSTFSQSQSTLGAQSSLNSQMDVGSISTRFQFGKKTDETGTISQISNNYDQKHTVASQAGPGNQRNQFGISSSSLNSGKLESTQSSSSSYTGASKGQSIQKSQLGVKPFGSFQSTGSTFSQSQSTLGAQSSLNSQKDVGSISTRFQFGKKTDETGTISQISNNYDQKHTVASQAGPGNQRNQFGISSSSLNSFKLESTLSSSSSYTGASKGQSIQKSQLGVKPFGSFQGTGSTFSQSQSTLGAQSSLNSQTDVGHISTVTAQVKPISQYGRRPSGSQFGQTSFQQSQYSLTSGSQIGERPETTGSIPQTSSNFSEKPVTASQTGSGNHRNQFGFSSSSLNGGKLESTQSSSSSYTGASKGQSIQKSQLGVKPFGSFQGTGSTFSQSQSTLGAQSSLNSQTDVGHISTVTAQVKPISQYGRRPSGSQFGQTSFQQSQYSLTSGSQIGERPETTGSIPQTSSNFSEKPVTASQTGSGNQGNQFGFSSSSLNGGKLESTQSSSSSYTGASKGQSIQKSQLGVKPFGSFQGTGSTFSQSQSTLGAQSSLNAQKDVGSISTRFQFGKKTDETGTISQISNNYDQKHTVASQAGPGNQRNQFGISSSSLNSGKLESTLSSSSSYTGASKGQSIQKSQLGVKPFGSFQGTGSTFSQSQSTLGAQSSLNAQKDVGSISTVTAQVKPISQYGKRPSGSQFGQTSFQQSEYSLTSGSQIGEELERTGSIHQTSSDFSEKPVTASQTGSGNQGNQFGFSSSSLNGGKLESTQSSSSSYTGASKGQSIQKSQLGVKPFGSFQGTGSTFSQSQSTLGAQSSLNAQKDVGSISTVTAQVKPISQYGKRPSGSQFGQTSFQQSEFSLTSGSQIGEELERTGSIHQTSSDFSEKPVTASQTGSGNQGNQFGFSSSSLNGGKLESTQSSSSSYTGASKGQSIQKSQLGVKPFGSFQGTGSTFSQSQSTLGAQSSLNSQTDVGHISTVTAQVKPISQYGKRPSGSQFGQTSFQQSEYSLTSGSQFGERPETTGSIPQTSSDFSEKPVTASQTGSGNQGNQFGFSSSSLNGGKLESTQSSSSSYTGASKGQSVQTSQSGLKPFGSFQNTESTFSQTQFGSTLGTQSSIDSQKSVGTISTSTAQVKPNSQYGIKHSGLLLNRTAFQQLHYSPTTEPKLSQKPTVTSQTGFQNERIQFGTSSTSLDSEKGSFSLLSTLVGQKPTGPLQTVSKHEKTKLSILSSSQFGNNSQSTPSNSFTVSPGLKNKVGQTAQFGVKPFGLSQTRESSFSQTHLSSTSGFQYGKKSLDLQSTQDSHQESQIGSVTGSQGLSGHSHTVKPFSHSLITGSGIQQPHLSFTLGDFLNKKPQSTSTTAFSQSSQSESGSLAKKLIVNKQTPFQSLVGLATGQNHRSSASASASSVLFRRTQTSRVSNYRVPQYGTKGLQPFGGSLKQTVHI